MYVAQRLLFILTLLLVSLHPAAAQKVKIACVGNSITYGSGIENRDQFSYPAQLQRWMGDLYEVRNFGVSGATVLSQGDKPWNCQAEYQEAIDFLPDIVIIKLGTNDSKPHNWQHAADFKADYLKLVRDFRTLPGSPRVILALPVPVFVPEKWGIRDSVVKNHIIPLIREVAKETRCETVDLYNPLLPFESCFPDKVHPNAMAAEVMVEEIYKLLFHRTGQHGSGRFNTATFAVPGTEYRSEAAGWGTGSNWMKQHEAINAIGASRRVDLVFLGNSITQAWGGEGRTVWSIVPELWDSLYKPRNAANFGISGDRTQHILWRINHGNFDKIQPKVIVLCIGVNNFRNNTAEEIAEGIRAILQALNKKVPSARILLSGPFPAGADPADPMRQQYADIHRIIRGFSSLPQVIYLKADEGFILPDGGLNYELMRSDGIHLTPAGYHRWATALEPHLKKYGL